MKNSGCFDSSEQIYSKRKAEEESENAREQEDDIRETRRRNPTRQAVLFPSYNKQNEIIIQAMILSGVKFFSVFNTL